uniref:UPAR/Ly6 domain-containing protein n=1 Tax=Oryzias latipes TaxID=8090 RepID=A0A3B3IP69_ORYLA
LLPISVTCKTSHCNSCGDLYLWWFPVLNIVPLEERVYCNMCACEGNEDYCVTATVFEGENTTTVKGCISELLCSVSNSFPSQFPGGKFSCCKGLQLVVVAFVSLALFS